MGAFDDETEVCSAAVSTWRSPNWWQWDLQLVITPAWRSHVLAAVHRRRWICAKKRALDQFKGLGDLLARGCGCHLYRSIVFRDTKPNWRALQPVPQDLEKVKVFQGKQDSGAGLATALVVLGCWEVGQNYKQPYRLSFTEHLPASVENSEEREFLGT